jgi:hypothetical protein
MYGYLMPASGGRSVALSKPRLFMGRENKNDKAAHLSQENAYCLLELIDGWWYIDDLRCPGGLKVSGCVCKRQRLVPGDEIAIGKHRYRISFEAPKHALGTGCSVAAKRDGRRDTKSREPAKVGPLGRLVPVGGGVDHQLTKTPVTIGRKPPCDIVIPAKTVSSRHCELSLTDGYWRVKDLGSHNGIRIDGKSCDEGWVLPQQRLAIADQRFQLEYEGQGPRPIPDEPDFSVRKPLMAQLGLSYRDIDEMVGDSEDEDPTSRRRWDLNADA